MSELLLPAGSLQAGIAAFKGGADAIYLGFAKYSARKDARNFTTEEFAKISSYAKENGKRIYVALNTIVDDSSLGEVVLLAREAAFYSCDGIIVQDLGVAAKIHRLFPRVPLHASTQMAVHTAEGVRYLREKGFSQVVLARELTLREIEAIRQSCPDIKLEVFIHGALCYGFSGLCMASERLCGRSANRGACAQICRSFFTVSKDPLKPSFLTPQPEAREAWWFSMSDLDGTGAVARLREMGIDTLKVEGRMKGPAYTMAAAEYYRALLDGRSDVRDLKTNLQILFARRQTGGWLTSYGREKQDFTERRTTLGSVGYPGPRGVPIGLVERVTPKGVVVTLKEELALRDGLLSFRASSVAPVEAVRFGLSAMADAYGRPIARAEKGQTVLLSWPPEERLPKEGTEISVISRHDRTLPLFGKELKPLQLPLALDVILEEGRLTLETRLDFLSKKVRKIYPMAMEQAQREQENEKNLGSIFAESDRSFFSLGTMRVVNRTARQTGSIFLPLSRLKTFRRDWYDSLDALARRYLSEVPEAKREGEAIRGEILPERNLLSTSRKIPFLDVVELSRADHPEERLFSVLGRKYLPLSPVMTDEAAFLSALDALVAKLQANGVLSSVRFGLNNIAQVAWARRHGECRVFADIYLYLANGEAASFLARELPSLCGGYLFLENRNCDEALWPFPPTVVSPSFCVPLFISRSCFRHDSLQLSCASCPHQGSWYVTQQDRKFHVMVKNCLTIVVEA